MNMVLSSSTYRFNLKLLFFIYYYVYMWQSNYFTMFDSSEVSLEI